MKRRMAGVLLVLGVCVVGLAARQGAGILQQLSIDDSQAQDSFFNALWSGSRWIPGGQHVFKAAGPEEKAAIVRAVGTLVKAYTRTPAFRNRYAEYWERNKPQPDKPPPSLDAQNKEMDEALRKMEESIKTMPPEMQEEMKQTVAALKAQQEASRKDPQVRAMLERGAKMQQEQSAARLKEELRAYEAEHPRNIDALIAKRLKDFLDVSASVDYNARLVKQGNVMRFASPDLENKPDEWKLCFRAGKQATDAARAFAMEWLKELKGTS
ncbi:MAG TPA: hypothetical protein VK886_03450 [Vicinamibacterales bacterium]|nr:hypothetical protein [Vicinamibacterales bacterium]